MVAYCVSLRFVHLNAAFFHAENTDNILENYRSPDTAQNLAVTLKIGRSINQEKRTFPAITTFEYISLSIRLSVLSICIELSNYTHYCLKYMNNTCLNIYVKCSMQLSVDCTKDLFPVSETIRRLIATFPYSGLITSFLELL